MDIICKSVEVSAKNAWEAKAEIKSLESVKFETEMEQDTMLDAIGKEYVKEYFNLIDEE